MAEKSFVLLSLKDDKAKNLSKALGNDTCRKILDYLASKGDATETQISKDLKVPLSTVNYNMKLLADNGLVSADEYHYSEKGKEVIHYKMKNRYIVIAPEPEDEQSLMKKLKGMIPAVVILGVGTFVIGLFEFIFNAGRATAGAVPKLAAYGANEATSEIVSDASTEMVMATREIGTAVVSSPAISQHITMWFFFGGVFALLCFALWTLVKKD